MHALVDRVIDLLSYSVSDTRFQHSKRVADCCRRMGATYRVDELGCEFVGWAHDIAREWRPQQLLRYAVQKDPENVDSVEAENPILLHGHVGSLVISEELQLEDDRLIEAVRFHTLGKPDFCEVGKVLYCADYLEPGRESVREEVRLAVGEVSLDALVGMVITDTQRRGFALADRTEAMYRSVTSESSPR